MLDTPHRGPGVPSGLLVGSRSALFSVLPPPLHTLPEPKCDVRCESYDPWSPDDRFLPPPPCFSKVELDLPLSLYLLLFMLSLYLSLLDVFFPSRHRDSIWLD